VTIRHLIRGADGSPDGALVLLHGRGADEHDLVPLLDELDPQRRLVGVTPRAPLALPPGGAHWYRLGGIGTPDAASFLPTYEALGAWLGELPAITGVPLERTVLGGFSQGCVMTYAMVYGAGRPALAGAICLSGFLPAVDGFELDPSARASTPVAIAHGRGDAVIGFGFGEAARDRLTAAGVHPVWLPSELGHTIDPRHLPALRALVDAALPAAA
jgi:phospholipase/carboxylesterase